MANTSTDGNPWHSQKRASMVVHSTTHPSTCGQLGPLPPVDTLQLQLKLYLLMPPSLRPQFYSSMPLRRQFLERPPQWPWSPGLKLNNVASALLVQDPTAALCTLYSVINLQMEFNSTGATCVSNLALLPWLLPNDLSRHAAWSVSLY